MASWATALASGLRERGIASQMAALVGQTGVAVFRVAFETWVADPQTQDLSTVLRDSFEELRRAAVTPSR